MSRTLKQTTAHTIVSFDGTKIHYEITPGNPDKPTLLFLHGMGGDLTAWDKERAYFQRLDFPTLAPDLRGHGLSNRPSKAKDYALSAYAHDITFLMDLHQGPYIVIGHCFGGIIALTMEATMQPALQSLVLIDTGYKAPVFSEKVAQSPVSKFSLELLKRFPIRIGWPGHTNYEHFLGSSDFDPKRIFFDVWHTSLQSYLYTAQSILSFQGEQLLPRIQTQTLIIEGTEDSIFPPQVAEILAERIKHSQLEFIPGANHILVINNPEDVNQTIYQFIKDN